MKLVSFHLMPYRPLDLTEAAKHRSPQRQREAWRKREDWGATSRSSRTLSQLGCLLGTQRRSCGSPAPAKRLAERLQDGDVRRGSTSVHYLSDIAVDLVYVDDADTGLCR
jgi:hypothetical protein